jgi:hypothetical protein
MHGSLFVPPTLLLVFGNPTCKTSLAGAQNTAIPLYLFVQYIHYQSDTTTCSILLKKVNRRVVPAPLLKGKSPCFASGTKQGP